MTSSSLMTSHLPSPERCHRCHFHQRSKNSFCKKIHKAQKRLTITLSFFALSWSVRVKAACWTLMKSTPGRVLLARYSREDQLLQRSRNQSSLLGTCRQVRMFFLVKVVWGKLRLAFSYQNCPYQKYLTGRSFSSVKVVFQRWLVCVGYQLKSRFYS